MPLKKLTMKPGVNRENTRYTNENGWYDGDKIRFRQGTPEKIGGWNAYTPTNTYLGVCRSLWPWTSTTGVKYLGVGTNLKFYIENGETYYDITPIRDVTGVGDVTFAATDGSDIIVVTDVGFGSNVGDFVSFSGVDPDGLGANGNITQAVLEQEFQIATVIDPDNYTIVAVTANAFDVGDGGPNVVGTYEVPVGNENAAAIYGWGAGFWDNGSWNEELTSNSTFRIWNQQNFGQDLVFGPNGGPIYYWSADGVSPLSVHGDLLSLLPGASDVPLFQNLLLVADVARQVLVFGTNYSDDVVLDPMLVRWSDREDATNWTTSTISLAGKLRLSHGSTIVACAQTRQEILIWTDTSLYSLQFTGSTNSVWVATLLSDNITIISDRAWVTASGKTYWMGVDKFYVYDGTVSTLKCDLLQYIFDGVPGFNVTQSLQSFSSTVEKFNEVWWFYCSADSETIDRYAIFNYTENVWYYGIMARTAWIDAGVLGHYPIAADDVTKKLQAQESGTDDNATGAGGIGITSYITSAEFDLDDGNNFAFVWRVLPDITFRGSTAVSPALTMYLLPLANSGSGYNNNTSTNSNQSVASTSLAPITRTGTYPVEQFTGQINTRVRGRQMSIKVESTALGVQWQLGSPRIDVRADGRR